MAEAKRTNARTKESPGSSLDPLVDIDSAPVDAAMGNRYIKSIAKLINACIKKCGTWRPQRWIDWRLRAKNQITRTEKMSSHMLFAPKAHLVTNMPAMDNPMKRWETSTSHPRGRRVATEDTKSCLLYTSEVSRFLGMMGS